MPKGYPIDLSKGKFCPRCEILKPLDQFSASKTSAHGLQSYCKLCMSARHDEYRRKNLKSIAVKQRNRYAENKERYRGYDIKRRYKFTLEDYKSLAEKQNGCCKICGTKKPSVREKYFHVDHCHSTGKIRGLLCSDCNMGLGKFKDKPELLISAARYLTECSGES